MRCLPIVFVMGCAATSPTPPTSPTPRPVSSPVQETIPAEPISVKPWGYGLPRGGLLFTSPFPSKRLTPCEVNRPQPGDGCVRPEDPSKAARQFFNDGVAAFEARNFSDAQLAFLRAFALKRHWQIAANLGHVELELGEVHDAIVRLEFAAFETDQNPDAIPKDKADIAALLKEAKARWKDPKKPANGPGRPPRSTP